MLGVNHRGCELSQKVNVSMVEIVVVHYRQIRPTVAMLNAFFASYPDLRIVVVDNSGGSCNVFEEVLPHIPAHAEKIEVWNNPATEHGARGPLSHGAGLDLAISKTQKPYLLSLESDLFILQRGPIEFMCSLMEQGYDWAGIGQKPVNGIFSSFSPSFGIFKAKPIRDNNISFRVKPAFETLVDSDHPLWVHHRQATERIAENLFLLFPEGKPPDTYRRHKADLQRIEHDHLNYFDTGEWLHEALTRLGFRGYLFLPPPGVYHSWGSRDETIFTSNLAERMPWFDINQFLPDALKYFDCETITPLDCLSLQSVNDEPPSQWRVVGGGSGVDVHAVADGLQLLIDLPAEGYIYFGLEGSGFSNPPSSSLGAMISPSTIYRVTWNVHFDPKVTAKLWVIEYDDQERLCHHTRTCRCGSDTFDFCSSSKTIGFRVFFRLAGTGQMLIKSVEVKPASVKDKHKTEGSCARAFLPSANKYRKKKKGVVLVSADALRADFHELFQCENALDLIPTLSQFIGSSKAPASAYSTAPWTLPSHMSMFTGLFPHQHGYGIDFKVGKAYPMPTQLPFLPECLARNGVMSYGFHNGGVMDANRGFGHGWTSYTGSHPGDVDNPIHDFIRSFPDFEDGYFAFIHTYAVHNYYKESGTPFSLDLLNTAERRYLNSLVSDWGNLRWMMAENLKLGRLADIRTQQVVRKLYLGAVLHFENLFKQLVEFLRSMDALDQTSIILTSDHGESLGELHRGVQHWSHMTVNVHDENIRVPFYIKNATAHEFEFSKRFSLVNLPRLIFTLFGLKSDEFNVENRDWLFSTGTTDQFGQEWESKIPAEGRVFRSVLFNSEKSFYLSGSNFRLEYLHDRIKNAIVEASEIDQDVVKMLNDEVRLYTNLVNERSPSLEMLGDDVVNMMRDLGYVE